MAKGQTPTITRILGWLTLIGFVLIILSWYARVSVELAYPIPLLLLCTGSFLFVFAGLPWAHTRGAARLKTAYLGAVGFFAGGALGMLFATGWHSGEEHGSLASDIFMVIATLWISAIACSWLGIWWGSRLHQRFARDAG